MQSCSSRTQPRLKYMADSAKQIAESIDRTGLRDKLNEVFQAAITRARQSQQEPAQPAIKETTGVDSVDDALPE
jgi:hypothetical protein